MKNHLLILFVLLSFTNCKSQTEKENEIVKKNQTTSEIKTENINDYSDIESFKDYYTKANEITQSKLNLKKNDRKSGVRTGCVYKNKLYWSGVRFLPAEKRMDAYLFICNLDFSNLEYKKMDKTKISGSFQKYIESNF